MSEFDEPLVVPPTLEGERLDRFVALVTGWSRATVAELSDLIDRLVRLLWSGPGRADS